MGQTKLRAAVGLGAALAALAAGACRSEPTERTPMPTPPHSVVSPPAPPLRGHARDLDGRPLAGAVIRAEPRAPFEDCPDARVAVETTAGPDGAYAFAGLAPGDWAITCSIDGAVRAPAGRVETPAVSTFDIALPEGPFVTGTLVDDATGAPVAGARVRLFELGEDLVAEPTTDANGRFSANFHRDDVWVTRFRLSATGYAKVPICVSPEREDGIGEGERVEFPLRARRGVTLRGPVTGPSGPVAGARVFVWHMAAYSDLDVRTLTTDAAGRYEAANLLDGEAAVFVSAPGLAEAAAHRLEYVGADREDSRFLWGSPEECRVAVGESGEATHDVTLVAVEPWPTFTVEGRVLGEDGAPIEGATVRCVHEIDDRHATTGADGSFKLPGVLTDGENAQIVAEHPGHEGFAPPVNGPAGGVTSGVEIRLPRLPRLHGRVASPGGAPIAGARVIVVASDTPGVCAFGIGPGGPSFTAYETRTGADGSYSLAYQRRGVLRVRAEAAGLPPSDVVLGEDHSGKEVVIDVAMAPRPTFTGRVVRKGTSEGAGGVAVAVVPEPWPEGSWVTNEALRSAVVRAVTSADGSFRIADMLPGRWMLLVGGGDWTSVTAAADASRAGPLVVEVEPALALGGALAFADGRPAAGVKVTLWPKPPEDCVGTDAIGSYRVTGLDGRFLVRGLPAGRYWLTARLGSPEIEELTAGPLDAGRRDLALRCVPSR